MLFTVEEMELICIFHAGTLSETLETLRGVAPGIEFPAKKAAAESAVGKLSGMSFGDTVSLAFDSE